MKCFLKVLYMNRTMTRNGTGMKLSSWRCRQRHKLGDWYHQFCATKNQINSSLTVLVCQYHQYDEMYFVFHTFSGDIEKLNIDDPRVAVWDISRVADLVINAGLIDWLLAKRT